MKDIILKDSVKLFGFKSGFSFWFRWNFLDPIKIFYLKYIIARPLCTYCGYFLCNENCNAKKIFGRRNIIKYEKERYKQIDEESKHVEISDDGFCVYCGEEPAQITIPNPNFDKLDRWEVCRVCEKIIEQQHKLSFGMILSKKELGKEFGEKIMEEANKKLDEISYESGKEIFSEELIIKKR